MLTLTAIAVTDILATTVRIFARAPGPVQSASKIRRKLEAYDAVIRADWRRDVEAEARGAEEAAPARGSDCAASARSRGNPLPLQNVLLCTGMPCIRAIAHESPSSRDGSARGCRDPRHRDCSNSVPLLPTSVLKTGVRSTLWSIG